MKWLLFLAFAAPSWSAMIQLTGRYGPLTLGTGESILLEYQQLHPEKWPDMRFVRLTATTPDELDYSATALQVQFESPDGTYVLDVGIHQMERYHYYSASPLLGQVYYDF